MTSCFAAADSAGGLSLCSDLKAQTLNFSNDDEDLNYNALGSVCSANRFETVIEWDW